MNKRGNHQGRPTVKVSYLPNTAEKILENRHDVESALSRISSKQNGRQMKVTVDWGKSKPKNYGLSRITKGAKTLYFSEESSVNIHSLTSGEINKLFQKYDNGIILCKL